MAIEVVGIVWYRRGDYRRLKKMFKDGPKLPDTFEDWLENARRVCVTLQAQGIVFEKAYIDPDTFPAWCAARGLEMDEKARSMYATEFAVQKHPRT